MFWQDPDDIVVVYRILGIYHIFDPHCTCTILVSKVGVSMAAFHVLTYSSWSLESNTWRSDNILGAWDVYLAYSCSLLICQSHLKNIELVCCMARTYCFVAGKICQCRHVTMFMVISVLVYIYLFIAVLEGRILHLLGVQASLRPRIWRHVVPRSLGRTGEPTKTGKNLPSLKPTAKAAEMSKHAWGCLVTEIAMNELTQLAPLQ